MESEAERPEAAEDGGVGESGASKRSTTQETRTVPKLLLGPRDTF